VRTIFRRGVLAFVALIFAFGTNVLVLLPAHAGGPGQVYVYGKTYTKCMSNMAWSIKVQRANGYDVTGENPCRKTGRGDRYFGDYVANPE
jgi:hypothetical protein